MPLEWTLGWQKLDWGNRYLVLGGLRDLNPIDIPALTRPGMLQREQETRIPVPQIFARLGLAPSTSDRRLLPVPLRAQCAEPVRHLLFGRGLALGRLQCRDGRQRLGPRRRSATGSFLKRAANVMPSNSGQLGVALTHTVDDWATKFGFYATQFHSRAGYSGVIKSLRPAAAPPFVPGDPDGLNPTVLHRVAGGHPHVRR